MLNSIQFMRLVAALSVLYGHLAWWVLPGRNWAGCGKDDLFCGAIGVDIFFCISGFLMAVTTQNKAAGIRTSFGFFIRRLFRIWPLYAAVTVFYKVVLMTWYDTDLGSLFFLPYKSPTGFWDPALSPGWTLNFEMYFYALTAVCLLFSWRIKLAAPILVLLGVVSSFMDDTFYFTASIIVEFALGIGLGFLWMNRSMWERLTGYRAAILIAAVLLFLFAARGTDWLAPFGMSVPRMDVRLHFPDLVVPRYLGWGIPAALLLLAVMLYEDMISRRIAFLGDYTYSIYLVHVPILVFAERLAKEHAWGPSYALAGGILAAVGAASLLTYYAIERPAQKAGALLGSVAEGKFGRRLKLQPR